MIQYACNLSCKGCITMTDYLRKGSVSITDGEQWLKSWSKQLDIGTICLFGGEPLMNKDLILWIRAVRKYFPTSTIKIITNGTYLKNKNILAELFEAGNVEYQISLHWRTGDKFNSIKQELIKQLREYQDWAIINSPRQEVIMSFERNTVKIQLAVFGEFVIPYQGHGATMKPWNSADISASYAHCGSPQNPILYKNKIYKCGPIANLRDTLALHNLLDNVEWQEYLNYNGYSSTDDLTELVDNFNKPNKICSMCASDRTSAEIDHYSPDAVIEKKEIVWLN